jgi:hypothetical protein
MAESYPPEAYDPAFRGQELETVYFDTPGFRLRKARRRGDRYLTLRIRCYGGPGAESYALSAKTEGRKFRTPVRPAVAHLALQGDLSGAIRLLPADLLARLLELAGEEPLGPVVSVCTRRYAVEDDQDRLTLDLDVHTDTGKRLAAHILEFKSTRPGQPPPDALAALDLRPIKISKFLWATLWR